MGKFIEEFYYGNLDPQARSTKQNKTVQKQYSRRKSLRERSFLLVVLNVHRINGFFRHPIFLVPPTRKIA